MSGKKYALYLAGLFLVFFILNSSSFMKWLYPVSYADEIKVAAENFEVDPLLILTIIQIESQFIDDISSHKGAVGIMQIMPETALWAMEEAGLDQSLTLEDLKRPEVNISIGSWYLRFLNRKYDHDFFMVVAAYNAGPGRVDDWLREHVWDGSYRNLDEIPFRETRDYLKRALYFYTQYQSIYGAELTS